MMESQFAQGTSLIHRLDPRGKLITAVVFAVAAATVSNPAALFLAFTVSLVTVFLARLPLGMVIKRLAVANGLILLIWFFLPLTYGETTLFSLGGFAVSREGVGYALGITVKCNTILLIMMALPATMSLHDLGHALAGLAVPGKIVHLFLFTCRYIQVIVREYERLRNAMRIRGFKAGTTMHTYRSYAYLVGMLLVRSYDRAERIYQAMRCRGFHGTYYTLTRYSPGTRDVVYLSLMTGAILGIVTLQWILHG